MFQNILTRFATASSARPYSSDTVLDFLVHLEDLRTGSQSDVLLEPEGIRQPNVGRHTIFVVEEDRSPLPPSYQLGTPSVRAADEDRLAQLMLMLVIHGDVVGTSVVSVPLEAACLDSGGF